MIHRAGFGVLTAHGAVFHGSVCAMIAALGLACSSSADSDTRALEAAPACSASAADAWTNQGFSDQTRRFHIEFDVTPSTAGGDAVVGLSAAPASDLAALAASVRFTAAGMIDAGDGASYRSDAALPYQPGTTYHLRMDVHVPTRRYSVWVRSADGDYAAIARDYAFRTGSASAAPTKNALNNLASKLDTGRGALALCGVAVATDATTADGCLVASAGDGFVAVPVTAADVLATATFTATASAATVDAVIGLSSGPATRFTDLAASVRLAPSGRIEVRDQDRYRADMSQSYGTGPLDFRVIADLTSHTYSVFQGTYSFAGELARQYGFRTEQRAAQKLDHLAFTVDGAQGSVSVCWPANRASRGAAYSREGSHAALPLPGDQALLSDGQRTRRIDASGQVIAELPAGGALATDATGDVFIARVANTTLTIDKYDARAGHAWSATREVPSATVIQAVAADATGAVSIAGRSLSASGSTVVRFTAAGELAAQLTLPGSRVTLDADQPIVASGDGSRLQITRYDASGSMIWQRSFTGDAAVSAMTVDADHGVVFGGELATDVDFGGGTLALFRPDTGPQNAFVVKLSPAGEHVFSRKTGDSYVHGIATDGARIVVSTTLQTQFQYAHLEQYDAAGRFVAELSAMTGLGEEGDAGEVVMSRAGRVWWNVATEWPLFPKWPYLVALQL